jgi:hypothetical protein
MVAKRPVSRAQGQPLSLPRAGHQAGPPSTGSHTIFRPSCAFLRGSGTRARARGESDWIPTSCTRLGGPEACTGHAAVGDWSDARAHRRMIAWLHVDGGSGLDQRAAASSTGPSRCSPPSFPPPTCLTLEPRLPARDCFSLRSRAPNPASQARAQAPIVRWRRDRRRRSFARGRSRAANRVTRLSAGALRWTALRIDRSPRRSASFE